MPQGLDVKKSSYAEELYNLLYRIKEVEMNPSLLQDNFSLYFILSELKEKGKTPEEAAAEIIEKFPEAKELAEQYHSNFQKFGATDWYEWRVKYWDTKWNSYDCYFKTDEHGIAITFSTAWSPCTPVMKKLIEDNPELTFSYEYDEPGMQFRGSIEGSNGQVTKDHYEEYEYQEEEDEEDE
ncbi:hypothetical protein A8E62_31965 [Burkholderia cenocepacia]|uniref:YubB ferredoxin-like domain-containing protein n=2 Tax=Burkholderiales TaxID=80840 RepID=A0A1V2VTN7_9BURK|nr:hypothetical protein A8E62_31965 [Burkholderia cenocepacia]ONU51173.1 hypothetical protein A8E67_35540 [Burkholderia cenocepacia]ONU66294.1 hypothetical protein A8E68_07410 [Burkholderia cenocepacia]ONU71083.1 hypothetical protein A8E63_40900 [Burkholderia cenocepacia]ONU76342.1 hypothetical protein A8E72_34075 [Burkholderia cenocepacia]